MGLPFGTFGFELKEGTVELRDGGKLYDQFSNSEIAAPGKVLTLTGDSKLEWKKVTTKSDGAHIVPNSDTDQIATLTFDTDELDATQGMTYFVDIEKVGGVTDNDVLHVTGDANLGGVPDVMALPDASGIEAGDSFSILTSVGSLTGEFDFKESNLPELDAGLTWEIFYDRDDYTTVNDPAFLNQWIGNGVKDVVLYVDEIDVSISDETMVEADGTMLFNVELSRSSQSEVTIDWSTQFSVTRKRLTRF